MSIPAGKLRNACRFERRNETADAYGNVSTGWATLLSRKGWLKFGSSRERMEGGRAESAVKGTLWLRADSETLAITAADRVEIDGAMFAIRSVVAPVQTGRVEMVVEMGAAG